MSDPLSLVRQATIHGAPVNYANGQYSFGQYTFPETTKTAFRRTLKSNEYFYTLKDIFFFLENVDLSVADYRRKAVEARKITAVVEQDRQALKDYLTGAISNCPQIDVHAAAEFSQGASSSSAAGGMQGTHPGPALSSTARVGAGAAGRGVAPGSATPAAPILSAEQLRAKRERYAARLDESIKRAKIAVGAESADATKKSSKRKGLLPGFSSTLDAAAAAMGEGTGAAVGAGTEGANGSGTDAGTADEPLVDAEFLSADRCLLGSLRAGDVATRTRNSVLVSQQDFTFALKLFHDKVLKYAKAGEAGVPSAPTTAASSRAAGGRAVAPHAAAASTAKAGAAGTAGAARAARGPPRRTPIIIVPNALTSVITLLNVQDFLVGGAYISAEEKKKAGAKKEKEVLIVRPPTGPGQPQLMYKVIDDARRLQTEEDWDRVVAVFASGQTWQFKDWKHMSNPVDLFQKVLGVHAAVEGTVVDPVIQSWNCKVLKVNLFKQHLNASLAREFWLYLDDFVRLHKPHYMPPDPRTIAARSAAAAGSGGGGSSSRGGGDRQQQNSAAPIAAR